jgi:hypothetical protein
MKQNICYFIVIVVLFINIIYFLYETYYKKNKLLIVQSKTYYLVSMLGIFLSGWTIKLCLIFMN